LPEDSGASGSEFEMMCGCPKELFIALGEVISHGKTYLSGEISTVEFRTGLAKSDRLLRAWQAKRDIYLQTIHTGDYWLTRFAMLQFYESCESQIPSRGMLTLLKSNGEW
jgi:hypothetical protein